MSAGYKIARITGTSLLLAGLACCTARRTFPDPSPGWHAGDYSVLFGRLQKIASTTPDAPPVWTLRFGTGNDAYLGEVALTPPEKLTGYSGGETLEVHGHLMDQSTGDAFSGRWYAVDSIIMWRGQK